MKVRVGSLVEIDHEHWGVIRVTITGFDESRNSGAIMVDFTHNGSNSWGYQRDITRVITY